ncbi:hypothetical protein EPH95_15935 [Salicibibacter halophilus]|uniref:Uncharacterized protein n=1 Tax=Salicibibacter halophilus TaxID=2502791 RepID=A0A514LKV5_9BACI|nr:hypothetical protein [Salicibibacter halophilus]QDI92496.1 hypothetical protein EPH95_15935 [Salicibibacter halophilus]
MGTFAFMMILGAASLPDLGEVESWALNIVTQAITLIVVFLVTKHLAKFRVGAVVSACIFAGVVTFVVQNWGQVTDWIEALIDLL